MKTDLSKNRRTTRIAAMAGGAALVFVAIGAATPANANRHLRPLTLTPLDNALGVAEQHSATTTVQTAPNYGLVAGLNDQGNQASFIAIKDDTAPQDYSFNIDDSTAQAQLQSDGSVMITDSQGELLNFIATPWAKDALGNNVPTSFTVNGTTITQHVDAAERECDE